VLIFRQKVKVSKGRICKATRGVPISVLVMLFIDAI